MRTKQRVASSEQKSVVAEQEQNSTEPQPKAERRRSAGSKQKPVVTKVTKEKPSSVRGGRNTPPPAAVAKQPLKGARQEFKSEHDAISEYVRSRLVRECAKRGAPTEVARRTGLRIPTVHNILKGIRGVGESTARVFAEYWGLTYAELEREALGIPARKSGDSLPNLSATLEFCQTDYPRDFLIAYAKLARQATEDRRRAEWLADVDAQLRVWASGAAIAPLGRLERPMDPRAQARIERLRSRAK